MAQQSSAAAVPAVVRDLSLVVARALQWGELCEAVVAAAGPTLETVRYQDTFRGGNLAGGSRASISAWSSDIRSGRSPARKSSAPSSRWSKRASPGSGRSCVRETWQNGRSSRGGWRGEPALAMAIVGPGPAPGGAGAGLRRPGDALALGARLGGLHGRRRALVGRGGVVLVLAARWTKTAHGRSCRRSTGTRRRRFRRSIATPGSSSRKRPSRAKRLLSTSCWGATSTSTPAAVCSVASPATIIRSTTDPLDDVPLVELLTALRARRRRPVGSLPPDPRRRHDLAVALAEGRPGRRLHQQGQRPLLFVLPFLNPVTGLTRLGTREWIVKPAWKSMQQNVLRWFYQAYVNRLGMHLIELLSGRLAIGAAQYRRLTRRPHATLPAGSTRSWSRSPFSSPVAHRGRQVTIDRDDSRRLFGRPNLVKARLATLGLDSSSLDRLEGARWIESSGYPVSAAAESRRDRASRQAAISAAADCDLLVLVVDGCQPDHANDSNTY